MKNKRIILFAILGFMAGLMVFGVGQLLGAEGELARWQTTGDWSRLLDRGFVPAPKHFLAAVHYQNEEALSRLASEGFSPFEPVDPRDVPVAWGIEASTTPFEWACARGYWTGVKKFWNDGSPSPEEAIKGVRMAAAYLRKFPDARDRDGVSVIHTLLTRGLTREEEIGDVIARSREVFGPSDHQLVQEVFKLPHERGMTLWHDVLERDDPELWEAAMALAGLSLTDWFELCFRDSESSVTSPSAAAASGASATPSSKGEPLFYALLRSPHSGSSGAAAGGEGTRAHALWTHWIGRDEESGLSVVVGDETYTPFCAQLLNKDNPPLHRLLHDMGDSAFLSPLAVIRDIYALLAHLEKPGREGTLEKLLTLTRPFGASGQFSLTEYAYFCMAQKEQARDPLTQDFKNLYVTFYRLEQERLKLPLLWSLLENTLDEEERWRIIRSNPKWSAFSHALESRVNQVMESHWVLKSGLIEPTEPGGTGEMVARGIELLGDMIPLPGAKTVASLVSLGIKTYQKAEAERRRDHGTAGFTSISGLEKITSALTLTLAEIYKEPIDRLTEDSAKTLGEYMAKRVILFFTDFEPLEDLSLEENIALQLMDREEGVRARLKEKLIPHLFRTTLQLEGGGEILAQSFLEGIGVRLKSGDCYVYVPKAFSGSLLAAPYGYRESLRDDESEVKRMGWGKVGDVPGGPRVIGDLPGRAGGVTVAGVLMAMAPEAAGIIGEASSPLTDRVAAAAEEGLRVVEEQGGAVAKELGARVPDLPAVSRAPKVSWCCSVQ